MDKNELIKLREDLVKEKETLESELGRFTTKNPNIKDDYRAIFPKPDQTDTSDEQAHSVTEYEADVSLEQSLELRLREINETIANIDAGAYGICNKCRSSIEEKRLKAIPVAKFCVACSKGIKLM